jgi:hypothetical protein
MRFDYTTFVIFWRIIAGKVASPLGADIAPENRSITEQRQAKYANKGRLQPLIAARKQQRR